MRASMSATGSVCIWLLPARFGHAGDDALMREVAQADAAKAELTVDSPRTAAAVAARVLPRLELLRPRCFRDHAFLRHARTPLLLCPEWKAELAQERESLLVRVGASRDRDVETPDGLHVVVVDFRKDDLLADAKRIVPASVEARRRETSEVADARQRDRDKPIEELPHAGAPKRDLGPDGIPSRILNPAIDFFARVICARWPAISVSSSIALSSERALTFASPTPMFSVILSMPGTFIGDLYENSSLRRPRTSWSKRSFRRGRYPFDSGFFRALAISGQGPPRSRRACRREP